MQTHTALELARAALQAMGLDAARGPQGTLRLAVEARGARIPVTLRACGDRVTVYAHLPVQGVEARMAAACNRVNRTLGDGCLVADERGRALLKQTVYLCDALYAHQALARALARQQSLLNQAMGALKELMLEGPPDGAPQR